MSYRVGIDLGTTSCAAAVSRPELAAPPELVPLAPGATVIPSVAFLDADGTLLFGDDAERRAPADPGRVARRFTRRIGDGTPLWIGGTSITADELAARFVAHIVDVVAARFGGPPSRIALSHPAGWGPHRLASLRAALDARGLGGLVRFVPEPQAAVLAHAARERLDPGAAVAVYDLGGGSLDAAVVRVLAPNRFVLVGRPEEIELGFVDFDEVVFEHVRSTLGPAWDALDPTDPAVLAAVARLRRACVAAKEALSSDTEVLIPVTLPGVDTSVRLARAEYEELIRPAVGEATDALERTIDSAGLDAGELAAVLLVGGSARVPLVTQEVSARLGRPVTVAADPKGIVAIGAALAAADQEPDLRTAPLPVVPTNVTPLWVRQPLPAGPPTGLPTDVLAGPPLGSLGGPPPPAAPLAAVPPAPVSDLSGGRRRLFTTVAAAVLAAAVVAGGAALATLNTPPGADADPTTATTPSVRSLPPVRELATEPTSAPTTLEQTQAPQPTAAQQPTRRSTQPPTRTTTTTRPPTTSATTTAPTSTATSNTTTVTGPPTTRASAPTTGDTGAGATAQAGAR